MQRPSSRPSFTLIEVVIAITLLGMLSLIALALMSTVGKASKKVNMEEYLYTEGQALLERIAHSIQESGIDYEEYYSWEVLAATDYGQNYGVYHQQFFDPGTNGPPPNNDYGALCTDGMTEYPNPGCPAGYLPDASTFDTDTGVHPYDGSGYDPEDANAFCDTVINPATGPCTTTLDFHQTNHLFLINKDGSLKTMFALEDGAVPAIAMMQMEGTDSDNNDIMDEWVCASTFTCTGGTGELPDPNDLLSSDGLDDDNFFPISPKSLAIDEITFYISPLEDPYKGYGETNTAVFENVQLQPRVTIVLTAHYQLYDSSGTAIPYEESSGFVGNVPSITLQTTLSTGATDQITGYQFP